MVNSRQKVQRIKINGRAKTERIFYLKNDGGLREVREIRAD